MRVQVYSYLASEKMQQVEWRQVEGKFQIAMGAESFWSQNTDRGCLHVFHCLLCLSSTTLFPPLAFFLFPSSLLFPCTT